MIFTLCSEGMIHMLGLQGINLRLIVPMLRRGGNERGRYTAFAREREACDSES